MLVIDTPDRKRVLAPRPGTEATKPPGSGRNTHPIQPARALRSGLPKARAVSSHPIQPHAATSGPRDQAQRETLSHAIDRMIRANKYSPEQIAGEVHRWDPRLAQRDVDRAILNGLLRYGRRDLGDWLEDKASRALHDIVHQPADTGRLYYNAVVLNVRDFGSRAGYELGLVSKKRMLTDIANDRRYTHALIETELNVLRHPLRDPFATVDLIYDLRERGDRLRRGQKDPDSLRG